jgi:hypothetical protein
MNFILAFGVACMFISDLITGLEVCFELNRRMRHLKYKNWYSNARY